MLKIQQSKFTKRAVLYIGFKCNLKCGFCYYAGSDQQWNTLESCKRDAYTFRTVYKNKFLDITGGEPTIYPDIIPLVQYCREIGLRPTCITNMQVLAKPEVAKLFQQAGIEDFLCSVHNLGNDYDYLVGVKGSFARVEKALDNIGYLNIPFRTNITINKNNFKNLKAITDFVFNKGCKVINYISCNLFRDHEQTRNLLVNFSEISPYLNEALEYCDANKMRAAVRYMPFCFLRGHENKCYNYHQLPYDIYEWDYKSWADAGSLAPAPKISTDTYRLMGDVQSYEYLANIFIGNNYIHPVQCDNCRLYAICDGINANYAAKFGTNNVCPYVGEKIVRPDYFINNA